MTQTQKKKEIIKIIAFKPLTANENLAANHPFYFMDIGFRMHRSRTKGLNSYVESSDWYGLQLWLVFKV